MRPVPPRLALSLCAVVGLLIFAPLLGTPFLWDDKSLIRDSELLKSPSNLGTALRRDFWALSANPREQGMYRPLTTASYFADRAVFGVQPLGPHVVSLALHFLAALLLGGLAVRLGASWQEALLAAVLFAFHPVCVEAVANVSSRGDLLATTLVLAALLALRRPGPSGVVLAAVAAALAQGAKESAFVVLPLALVLEWWAAGFRVERRRWVLVGAALAGVTVLMLALRTWALGEAVRAHANEGWVAVASGAAGVARYASRVVWPSPLVPYQTPTDASWLAVGLVVLALGAGVALLRRAPLVSLALAWFLVATAPVAGWLPVTVRFSGLLLYLPLTGLALVAARSLRTLKPLVAWAVPLALVAMSAALVPTWASDEALWQANVDAYPELPAPRLNLANALAQRGAPETREAYEAVVTAAAAAHDGKSLSMAELGLGNLLLRPAPNEAEPHFRRAQEASAGRLWQAGVNVAVAQAMQGRLDDALVTLEGQWATTPVKPVAETGLDFATRRGDAELIAKWRARR